MTGFVEGAYVDERRVVHNADGSPDEWGRYVDEQGWVRLGTGDLDGNWCIDAQGRVHDEQGMPSGQTLVVPQNWTVYYEPNPDDSVGWEGELTEPGEATANAIMQRQIDERNAGLSTTSASHTDPDDLEAFANRLQRPQEAPYSQGYKSRAGWNADENAPAAVARKPEYEYEETQVGWRAPDDANLAAQDGWVTQYEDRGTIADRAARTDTADATAGGFVLDSQGKPVNGRWGWVVDEETGFLLLFDPHRTEVSAPDGATLPVQSREEAWSLLRQGYKVRAVHHTTPVAGMPVKGAGMITLDHGRIVEITDESGHYRPDPTQQFAALQELIRQGYDLNSAKVMLTGGGGGRAGRPTGKAEWLDEAKQANPLYPTGNVSLRHEQFAQTQGDEYQIRAKMAVNEELRRKRAQTPPAAESADIRPDDDYRLSPSNVVGPSNDYRLSPSNIAGTPSDEYRLSPSNIAGLSDEYRLSPSNIAGPSDDYRLSPSNVVGSPSSVFVDQARGYLNTAGHSGFAEWFRTLKEEHQNLLLADPLIASVWQAKNAPPTPT